MFLSCHIRSIILTTRHLMHVVEYLFYFVSFFPYYRCVSWWPLGGRLDTIMFFGISYLT
jgi:hypothetical protein